MKDRTPLVPDVFVTIAAIAGISCAISSFILNPIDVIKIRMQNDITSSAKYNSMIQGMKTILKEETYLGFLRGIVPSMWREISYSSIRIGGYDSIRFSTKTIEAIFG